MMVVAVSCQLAELFIPLLGRGGGPQREKQQQVAFMPVCPAANNDLLGLLLLQQVLAAAPPHGGFASLLVPSYTPPVNVVGSKEECSITC